MALALFPEGLGHWIMRPALPMVARNNGTSWEFDFGHEQIAANLATPARSRRVGWAVLFSLREGIDGEFLEVFPSVRMAHVFDDADEAEEDF